MASGRNHVEALRRFGLGLPGAHEDHPWGELVLKAKGKVFVFLGKPGLDLKFSVKLPESGERLLDQPFAEPTGYGLGKSGWVTLSFDGHDVPEVREMCAWIEESYRAVAPKTLVKELDAAGGKGAAKPAAAEKKTAARRKAAPRRKA
jgi:predicted DNA-binding protein (MmcQ/YjbR family)